MYNHDDKYLARPGFEPGTFRLQAPVDTNEPSGPVCCYNSVFVCNMHTFHGRKLVSMVDDEI